MSTQDEFDASKANACATRAFKIALSFGHEYVTGEHLLASLLAEHSIVEALQQIGAEIQEIALDLNAHLLSSIIPKPSLIQDPRRTSALQRVTDRAVSQVMFSGRRIIDPSDLLISLLQEENSYAVYFLRKHGVDLLSAKQHFSHKQDELDEYEDGPLEEIMGEENQDTPPIGDFATKLKAEKVLRKYCTLLNEKATDGKVDPLIGRLQETETLSLILSRRFKNNPIIVGEAGVGKTALVKGLALKIVNNEVPEVLQNAKIWSLDLGTLLSGTKFRGDVEERLKSILKAIEVLGENESPKIVLFIDEIHMIMGAGAVSQGSMDISNLLKPALSTGELRCIGSTTYDEYRKHFEKDRALMRRFQKVDIQEPDIENTKRIVEGLSFAYEQFHNVQYDLTALHAAVELTSRYITDRVQPDKSLDVIDTAGARQQLIRSNNDKKTLITQEMIENEVAKIAKIPAFTVKQDENEKLLHLEGDLHDVVFDQAEAIEQLTGAVYMSRAGMREPNKPLGNYLFVGPTGVGKCLDYDQTVTVQISEDLAKIIDELL
jgi:ATP-dependent Clp protease ATP-binding subunit ClpA